MTFLNLRKLGLVLVAASTMAIVSCGGPTPEEEAAAKVEAEAMMNDLFGGIEDAIDEAATETETMVEDAVETAHDHVEGEAH